MVHRAATTKEYSHENCATIHEVKEYPMKMPITEQEVKMAIHNDFCLSFPKASAHRGT